MRCTTTAASRRSPRYFGKILPVLGSPTWWPAPDALQAACHRSRRLDEHDEVDGAHVDAELEARRRDDRLEPAGLELGLHLHALLARERAVVCAHELLTGEVVEVGGQPLGHAARVAEHDRRAMGADQLQDPWVHVRPDAAVCLGVVEPECVCNGPARRAVHKAPSLRHPWLRCVRTVKAPSLRHPWLRCVRTVRPRLVHVVDGHDDLDVERLA